MDHGHFEAAIVDLTKALAFPNPQSRDRVLLGRAYQLLGNFDQAMIEFEHALQMAPKALNSAAEDKDKGSGSGGADTAELRQISRACDVGIMDSCTGKQHLASAMRASHSLAPEHVLHCADQVSTYQ